MLNAPKPTPVRNAASIAVDRPSPVRNAAANVGRATPVRDAAAAAVRQAQTVQRDPARQAAEMAAAKTRAIANPSPVAQQRLAEVRQKQAQAAGAARAQPGIADTGTRTAAADVVQRDRLRRGLG
jgi:hypothetical protein